MSYLRKKLNNFKSHFLYPKLYKLFPSKFKHSLWPTRLKSRTFDFGKYNEEYQIGELLNIGAGPYFTSKNFISLDFLDGFSNKKIDKFGRMFLDLNKHLDSIPFKNLKVIYTSHCLEHFRKEDTIRLLNALYKSMSPKGVIRIIVPDAELVINKLKQNKLDYFAPIYSNFDFDNFDELNSLDFLYHLLSTPRCRFINKKFNKNYSKDEYLIFEKSNQEIIDFCNNHNFVNNKEGRFHLSCYSGKCMMDILKKAGFREVKLSAFMQSDCLILRDVPTFDGSHPWLSTYIEASK